MVVPEDLINKGIGVQLETAQMADLLSRMQLQAEAVPGSQVRVLVPPTRSDVLHACDVMEVSLDPHAAPFLMSSFTLSWV
jgi:phenylalanyl-tRNA synthetase beta chain